MAVVRALLGVVSRRRSFLVGGILCGAVSLEAHDLYIKLDNYFLEPNVSVRVPILNGTFDTSENGITRDRVLDISVLSHGERRRVDTAAWLGAGDTTMLALQLGGAGTYVIGASTRPNEIALAAEDFNAYLEHDGIPDVLERRRQNGELSDDAVERYAKHVKAIVQVGDKRDGPARWWRFWRRGDPSYLVPLGYPAEIVPLANPYTLTVDDELRVRCLVDGVPVANQLVTAGGEGATGAVEERSVRTDGDGVATFLLDERGTWYIKFINMVPLSGGELDYESKWATLTFGVR